MAMRKSNTWQIWCLPHKDRKLVLILIRYGRGVLVSDSRLLLARTSVRLAQQYVDSDLIRII